MPANASQALPDVQNTSNRGSRRGGGFNYQDRAIFERPSLLRDGGSQVEGISGKGLSSQAEPGSSEEVQATESPGSSVQQSFSQTESNPAPATSRRASAARGPMVGKGLRITKRQRYRINFIESEPLDPEEQEYLMDGFIRALDIFDEETAVGKLKKLEIRLSKARMGVLEEHIKSKFIQSSTITSESKLGGVASNDRQTETLGSSPAPSPQSQGSPLVPPSSVKRPTRSEAGHVTTETLKLPPPGTNTAKTPPPATNLVMSYVPQLLTKRKGMFDTARVVGWYLGGGGRKNVLITYGDQRNPLYEIVSATVFEKSFSQWLPVALFLERVDLPKTNAYWSGKTKVINIAWPRSTKEPVIWVLFNNEWVTMMDLESLQVDGNAEISLGRTQAKSLIMQCVKRLSNWYRAAGYEEEAGRYLNDFNELFPDFSAGKTQRVMSPVNELGQQLGARRPLAYQNLPSSQSGYLQTQRYQQGHQQQTAPLGQQNQQR